MQPEKWQKIEPILQAVLDQPSESREAYLREACGGDKALEDEVRSLIGAETDAGLFLEDGAMHVAARALAQQVPTGFELAAGAEVSHYRVLGKLGAGGIGVVYKAEDTRLHRFVALKFLSAGLTLDPGALGRFRIEARAASALNHPNICTLYDIGEFDGHSFLVMEFLEGETLAARIARGPLEPPELLRVATDIAGALEAAHRAGVIHRDIKPANIFVSGNGHVTVLDFGLAKMQPAGQATELATQTGTGVVLGTPAYMAPEQASGAAADQRADVWAFGMVLYELATGKRPGVGTRPPVAGQPGIEGIVHRCLEQEPGQRFQSMAEIVASLRALQGGSQPPMAANLGRRRVLWPVLAGGAVLASAGWMILHRTRPQAAGKHTIVVAEFSNTTGEPVFDDALRQGLSVQLQQSRYLELMPDERVQQTLRNMGRPDERLTPQVTREVCQRNSGSAVIEGSIAKLGSQYVLGLAARNCQTGAVLDQQQLTAAGREDVLPALGRATAVLRNRIGESLSTVRRDAPLANAVTPSLEALKAYTAGFKFLQSADPTAAVSQLQRAVELDPQFSMAYALLGRTYFDTSQPMLAAAALKKAYELRRRAGDRDQFWIVAQYHQMVTGNLEEVQHSTEAWAQQYPRDMEVHALLSALYQEFGRYGQAIAEGEKAVQVAPDFPFAHINRAWSYVLDGRTADGVRAFEEARRRGFEATDMLLLPYAIAFLKGDAQGMKAALAVGKQKPETEDWITHAESLVEAYKGNMEESRRLSRRAVGLARQSHQDERAALYMAGAAVREAFLGDAVEAQHLAREALLVKNNRDVAYGAAFAFVKSGAPAEAEPLMADLEKSFPEDSFVKFTYVPVIRAMIAIGKHQPAVALSLLEPSLPYELGVPGSWSGFYGCMYPTHVRGEAYLAAGDRAKAAAEFKKIKDHPAVVLFDPLGKAVAGIDVH